MNNDNINIGDACGEFVYRKLEREFTFGTRGGWWAGNDSLKKLLAASWLIIHVSKTNRRRINSRGDVIIQRDKCAEKIVVRWWPLPCDRRDCERASRSCVLTQAHLVAGRTRLTGSSLLTAVLDRARCWTLDRGRHPPDSALAAPPRWPELRQMVSISKYRATEVSVSNFWSVEVSTADGMVHFLTSFLDTGANWCYTTTNCQIRHAMQI